MKLSNEQIETLQNQLKNQSGNEIISQLKQMDGYSEEIIITAENNTLINKLGYTVDLQEEEIAHNSKIKINPKERKATWLEVAGEEDENSIPLDWNVVINADLPFIFHNAEPIDIELN